jgi:hypothetical protein
MNRSGFQATEVCLGPTAAVLRVRAGRRYPEAIGNERLGRQEADRHLVCGPIPLINRDSRRVKLYFLDSHRRFVRGDVRVGDLSPRG